jgi:hypothetical protein
MLMARPWMKFYPVDWRADPRLRMCSLAARGLWIDLMTYMHEGEPYGHLTIDGVPPPANGIAALVGRPVNEVGKALAELEARGVFDRAENGAIVSRRMVRDKAKDERDRANGKGGGNPKLRSPDNAGVNPPDNDRVGGEDKAQTPEARGQRGEGGGDTRARPLVSPEAMQLADRLAEICGHGTDPKTFPPAWHGAPMRVQAWLSGGWHTDIIVAAVREVVAKKRDGPIENIVYFEKPIARAVARQAASLPVVKSLEPQETSHVVQTGGDRRSAIAALKRIRSRLEERDAPGGGRAAGSRAAERVPEG